MVRRFIVFYILSLAPAFSAGAQLREIPYDSDSTFYRVDLALKQPGKCFYLFLEYDTIRYLPSNISQLKNLRGITFRNCANVGWNNAFQRLASLPNLEYRQNIITTI